MDGISDENQRKIRVLEAKIAELRGDTTRVESLKLDVAWYEDQERVKIVRNFPRGLYGKLVGKDSTALSNQFKTLKIPVEANKPVDLFAVIKWYDANRPRKQGTGLRASAGMPDEGAIARAERRQQLELETLEIKSKALAVDLEKKTGNAISADDVEKIFVWFESELRKLGERLGKRFGADSQELFNNTLDRIGRHLEELIPKNA